MENETILFCDIDDVLINSSFFIQKYVKDNTVFKTDMLSTIEQLKRNCQYYVDMIKEECNRAFVEKRLPNLNRFPNMEEFNVDGLSFDKLNSFQIKRFYKEPIKKAESYLEVAISILEQFLEERDMFLELDNMLMGESKDYDYVKEQLELEKFKTRLRENREFIENINKFCYDEVKRISFVAESNKSMPQYGALVKMDENDIIRNSEVKGNFNYSLYEKPCNDVYECISKSPIEYALENFNIERRESREKVNYDDIYTVSNVNKDAVFAIKKLILSGIVDKVCFITHHNGVREERAKRKMTQFLFPGTEFLGLRFHSTEHNLKRRFRSSKFDRAEETYSDIGPNMILLDDSMDNCNDWFNKGGSVILYRKITPAEKINGQEEFPYYRITDFDYLENRIEKIKEKGKVKKLEKK